MGSSEGTFDTKLHEAVRYGDLEGVKVALQQEYDPNLIGLYQWSPLHEAAHNGDVEILKLLLAKKGNPNKADYSQGRTAMHYAAELGHVQCLKMLVAAGGRYDIKDQSGKDSLDLVTPGGRKILERLKVRDLMQISPQEPPDLSLENTKDTASQGQSDDQSLSRRSSQDSAFGERKPVLGYVTMSVEYHSSKGTLKIRVWQITNLLLPPPHTSMIHTIYVKSYLYPDRKRECKRKTEEVRVEGSEGHMHLKKTKDKLSAQHVFTPVSFKFTKALEYSGISAETVKEKQLQVEVCITQRYSHRSFLIGMFLLPLKTAVKKVVKEKYPLIPCMNHTIPSNMRIYSASELHVTSNAANVFYSNPNFRVMIPEDVDDNSEKAVSNPDLKNEYSSSIEVDMSEKVVPKLDFSNLTLDESGYASEHHITISGELESPDSDKNKGASNESRKIRTVPIEDMGNKTRKERLQSYKPEVSSSDENVQGLSTCKVIEIEFGESDADTPREIKVDQGRKSKKSSGNKSGDHSSSGSRPETPTWDYYDVPIDGPTVVIDKLPQAEGPAPVLFPMDTTLAVRQMKAEELADGKKREKDKSKRKSKKKLEAIPGKAVPIVPQIVIVSPDENKDKHSMRKDERKDEVKIDVPVQKKVKSELKQATHIKTDTAKTNSLSQDTEKPLLREVTVVQPKPTQLKEAKFFVPKFKVSGLPLKDNNQPHAPPRSKKSARVKERKEENELPFNPIELKISKTPQSFGHSELNRVKQTSISIENSSSSVKTPCGSAPSFPSVLENVGIHRSVSETSALSRSLSSTSNSSVMLDMDKLSFASSDSHVVELDEDISITELQDDSDLFSTSSEIGAAFPKDVESGIDDVSLGTERFSPTKQVIPMQVFIDESFDSSDETLSHSFGKKLPVTEL